MDAMVKAVRGVVTLTEAEGLMVKPQLLEPVEKLGVGMAEAEAI